MTHQSLAVTASCYIWTHCSFLICAPDFGWNDSLIYSLNVTSHSTIFPFSCCLPPCPAAARSTHVLSLLAVVTCWLSIPDLYFCSPRWCVFLFPLGGCGASVLPFFSWLTLYHLCNLSLIISLFSNIPWPWVTKFQQKKFQEIFHSIPLFSAALGW